MLPADGTAAVQVYLQLLIMWQLSRWLIATVVVVVVLPTIGHHAADGGISGGEEQAVYELVGAGKAAPGALESGIAKLKARVLGGGGKPSGDTPATPATPALPGPPAVMCLGIGHGVHRGLLDGMASRSGGVAQYVVDGESIVHKAGFLKKAALAGAGVVVAPRLVGKGVLLRSAPHVLPARLFPGEPLHVLAELLKVDESVGPALELVGKRGDGSEWRVEVPLAGAPRTKVSAVLCCAVLCCAVLVLCGTAHADMAALR
jgi:hypothetical protein